MSEKTNDTSVPSTYEEVEKRKRDQRRAIPGFMEKVEREWHPLWRAMGVSTVAAHVAARHGYAVDDTAEGYYKIAEAELWVREEVARLVRVERATASRANWSLGVSILALVIAAAALWLKGTGRG